MGVEADFQAAIYTRLADQIAQPVYDVAPQGAAFPYVTIGEDDFRIFDAQESFNFDALARIHTWSRSGSKAEVKAIIGAVYAALHDFDLLMPRYGGTGQVDWRCYSLLREGSTVLREDDRTFHGVCDYRALIQSA